MSRFRHDMKLALKERARRAPVVIDLEPSEWEEVRDLAAGATPLAAWTMARHWIAATILLLATVAAPLVDAAAHHAL